MTAQRFMSTTGKPTVEELCSTFRDSAPRMRVLREKLDLVPDNLEEVDLYDLRRIINRWYLEDRELFDSMFPNMIEKNFMHIRTVDEVIIQSIPSLPLIKKEIEDAIVRNPRCAVSITFQRHTITGCFDRKVNNSSISMNNLKPKANPSLFFVLLVMNLPNGMQGNEKLLSSLSLSLPQ